MSLPTSPEHDRLESLRGELRALGYLEGRLERYFLRDLFSRPGRLAPAIRASVRAAILGGPMVAAATTACLVAWHPALGRRVADLVVLLVYSTGFAMLACLALGFAAAWAGLSAPRRAAPARRRAREVGVGIAALWLLWFLSWVVAHGSDGLRLVSYFGLGLVALMLGRLGGLVTLLLALEGVGVAREGESESRGVQRSAGLLLLLSLAALSGLVVLAGREPHEPPSPKIEAAAGGATVVVVGLDGIAWDDLPDGLGLASARLRSLAEAGFLRRLDPGETPVPPLVWTTIATGRDPLAHGVRSLLVPRVAGLHTAFPSGYGRPALRAVGRALIPWPAAAVPLSDQLRREKAFWEVAAEAGLEVLAVNWWATHPASIAKGTVVSDRAYASLVAGRELGREVYPPEFGHALAAAWRGRIEAPTPAEFNGPAAAAFQGDRFHSEIALSQPADRGPRITVLYLQGPDVLAAQPGSPAQAAQARARYGDWLEGVLTQLQVGPDSSRVVLLVAHPGRSRPGRDGFVLAVGGPIERDPKAVAASRARVRLEDIAPTVLAWTALPISAEQRGEALLESVAKSIRERLPIRRVSSFGRRARDPEDALDPTDTAAEERLRALGYVN